MDELAKHFWEGCAARELRYQQCDQCSRAQYYPRPFCAVCGHESLSWLVAAGTGTVYSATDIIRAPSPTFEKLVPYTMVLIDLDEGLRMMGHAAPQLSIGDRVKVAYREHEGRFLPYFERDH